VKFIVDTNILIKLEPTSLKHLESDSKKAFRLIREINEQNHNLYYHPASLEEFKNDKDEERKIFRTALVGKYTPIDGAPTGISTKYSSTIGTPVVGSHNWFDGVILCALEYDFSDYLVTEDIGARKNAAKLGYSERVISIDEALELLNSFKPKPIEFYPNVETIIATTLNVDDPIFQSFRGDYPGFDTWLSKCKREHRTVLVIKTNQNKYAAICILNEEKEDRHELKGKVLKVCSFKVSDDSLGLKYGEFLLKILFDYAFKNKFQHAFVEAFEKHELLVKLLQEFGFYVLPGKTSKGEIVLAKDFQPTDQERQRLSPLDFHIKYGPHNLILDERVNHYVIPIQPQYHSALFPELESQTLMLGEVRAYGNAILKAYLCHSKVRSLGQGDLVHFYRSIDSSELTIVGVLEDVLVSDNPHEISRFVGRRTVYTIAEIEQMCSTPVLALLFRASLTYVPPIGLSQLKASQVITGAPQQIVKMKPKGVTWILDRLKR
jgi:hypothetical protein